MSETQAIFFGVTHLDIPVSDLTQARRLYHDTLGFAEKKSGEGWLELDGGTLGLRLVLTRHPEHLTSLRVQSPTVEVGLDALLAAGAKLVSRAIRTPEQELIGVVRDRDGNTIYLWRPLTEDEYDFVPELPKEMTWAPDGEALLKSLLKSVPSLFRSLARRRVVAVAEELAAGTNIVTREIVIRGYILASPRVTRFRNRQPLIDHGIDVDRYREDWDAD
jgi:catechol 2,3-dioxygenase-like lactoylglutathione lyase family enzyme